MSTNTTLNKTGLLLLALVLVLITGCASTPEEGSRQPITHLYCDSYFVYDMCAMDIDNNGAVDFIYFSDDKDIILYWETMKPQTPDHLNYHKCAQIMDEPLRRSASELFFISDETSFLEKSNIETRIFLHYSRYFGRVNSCNNGEEEDEFGGVEEDEDF